MEAMPDTIPSYGSIATSTERDGGDEYIGDSSSFEFRYDHDDESGIDTATSSAEMLRSTAETFPFLTDDEESFGDDDDDEGYNGTLEAVTLIRQKRSFLLLNTFVVGIAVAILVYVILAFQENLHVNIKSKTTTTKSSSTVQVPTTTTSDIELDDNAVSYSSTDNSECQLHPNCDNLGLIGNCCPTTSGIMLGCCKAVKCQMNQGCAALGLNGDCCPTHFGVMLGCCT